MPDDQRAACRSFRGKKRLYPPFVARLGLGGCLFLTPFLPVRIWITGMLLIGAGLLWHRATQRWWPADRER